jgi:microtubule-associated protein-like 6
LTIQEDFIGAGTKDGYIYILNKSTLDVISMLDLKANLSKFNLSSYHPSVRSLDFLENKLLVGTFGSEIFEIDIPNITKAFEADKEKKKYPNTKSQGISKIVQCHYSPNNTWTNEVWGLAISSDLIFTCSDDATVRCWSLKNRKLLSSASLNIMTNEGESPSFEVAKDKKTNDYVDGSKGRSVLLTPDRKYVIVGSKDGRVRIFNFN